jgi:hypothetical protein
MEYLQYATSFTKREKSRRCKSSASKWFSSFSDRPPANIGKNEVGAKDKSQ